MMATRGSAPRPWLGASEEGVLEVLEDVRQALEE